MTGSDSQPQSPPSASADFDPDSQQAHMFFEPPHWSFRYANTFYTARVIALQDDKITLQCKCAVDTWSVETNRQALQVMLQSIRDAEQQQQSNDSFTADDAHDAFVTELPQGAQYTRESVESILHTALLRKDASRRRAVRQLLKLDRALTPTDEPDQNDDDGDNTEALQQEFVASTLQEQQVVS